METSVSIKSSHSSILMNTMWNVSHDKFICEMSMMLQFGYSPEEQRWMLEMCDYLDVQNMIVDGLRLSSKDSVEYFDFHKRIGLDYEGECLDIIEKSVQSLTNEQIMDLFNPNKSSLKF